MPSSCSRLVIYETAVTCPPTGIKKNKIKIISCRILREKKEE